MMESLHMPLLIEEINFSYFDTMAFDHVMALHHMMAHHHMMAQHHLMAFHHMMMCQGQGCRKTRKRFYRDPGRQIATFLLKHLLSDNLQDTAEVHRSSPVQLSLTVLHQVKVRNSKVCISFHLPRDVHSINYDDPLQW